MSVRFTSRHQAASPAPSLAPVPQRFASDGDYVVRSDSRALMSEAAGSFTAPGVLIISRAGPYQYGHCRDLGTAIPWLVGILQEHRRDVVPTAALERLPDHRFDGCRDVATG